MPKENKTVELKDEELEKVSGGVSNQIEGKCGITVGYRKCQQYDSSKAVCRSCLGKPLGFGEGNMVT